MPTGQQVSHTIALVNVDPADELAINRLLRELVRDFKVTVELLDELSPSEKRQVRLYAPNADVLTRAITAIVERTP